MLLAEYTAMKNINLMEKCRENREMDLRKNGGSRNYYLTDKKSSGHYPVRTIRVGNYDVIGSERACGDIEENP